jgi:putative addiction module component (TIGR02574 family)
MTTAEQILDFALDLPNDQRAFIAEKLIESLKSETFADDVAEAWHAEIRRRLDRVLAGEVTGRRWEDVREDLDRKLKELRKSVMTTSGPGDTLSMATARRTS